MERGTNPHNKQTTLTKQIMKNFKVKLINHLQEGEAIMALQANHEIHAARKAEKKLGFGWEAIVIK